MSSKAFIVLMMAILALGGSIGGAFAGGVAVGKGQNEEAPANSVPQSPSGQTQTPFDPSQLSQEQLQQIREQFLGQGDTGGGEGGFGDGGFRGRGGFGGGSGLIGTIETIEGSTVTIDTPQGPLEAIIDAATVIQRFAEGTAQDLQAGIRVTVTGERAEDGTVQARSILITPEGASLPIRGQ